MSYKILIVDDSKLARMAAVKALRTGHPGLQHLEAANAVEALATMQRDRPDIALVDFNMPEKDGLHLVADLRKQYPDMPIAVISANHQQQVIDRTAALNATFLPKPLAEQALAEFIATAVRDLEAGAR